MWSNRYAAERRGPLSTTTQDGECDEDACVKHHFFARPLPVAGSPTHITTVINNKGRGWAYLNNANSQWSDSLSDLNDMIVGHSRTEASMFPRPDMHHIENHAFLADQVKDFLSRI